MAEVAVRDVVIDIDHAPRRQPLAIEYCRALQIAAVQNRQHIIGLRDLLTLLKYILMREKIQKLRNGVAIDHQGLFPCRLQP